VNTSIKKLFPLATIVFLLSMSLTAALRSTQAQEGSRPEAKISNRDDSGQINNQGWLRQYKLYTPSSYNPERPMPLVLVFHGHEGTGASIADVTRFNKLAEQKGFIVVYPDGIDHNWNLRGSSAGKVDDVSFVTALIDHLKQTRNIDSHRIYAAGFSKGAIFAQDLACELPDQIAAVASVAGSLPVRLQAKCQAKTPVSMLMINGTNDLAVHYEGDEDKSERGALISVPDTINLWQTINQCSSAPKVQQLPASNPRSRFKVKVSRYPGCSSGSEVTLMAVANGGHLWPGGASQDASVNKFNADLGFNASQTIWDFFQRHSLP
jgi:polyhydroxybutyrate depolymerase